MVSADYVPRLVEPLLAQLLSELPAVMITGPRAAGKTTTALRHAATVVRLDREADAVAFRADPDVALQNLPEPVLLDEWQVVPEVLGAIKRSIDADTRPGRYLVAGSVRADLEAALWPGTGRLVRLPMWGLTVKEMSGRQGHTPLVDRLAESGLDALTLPDEVPDLRGYVDLASRGGFPDPALRLGSLAGMRWLDSYLDQLLTRDAEQMDTARDPLRLRRYFEAVAANTAGVVDEKTLYDAAGITRKTADAYERLLRNLLVVEAVPAWENNRLKRLTRLPKRYVTDSALAMAVLRLDGEGIMRSGDLLGRLIDTFAVAQLRADVEICHTRPRLYHLRQAEGRREIDLVVELAAGRVIAIEVKADAAPKPESARHLVWLRDELGEKFVAGVVLHTGPRVYRLDDRIAAAPIATLWG